MEPGPLVAGILAAVVALVVWLAWSGKRGYPFYDEVWVARFQRPEWRGLRLVIFGILILVWVALVIRVVDALL